MRDGFCRCICSCAFEVLLEGFIVTLEVAFLSIFFSFLIGIIIGVLRYSRIPFLSPVLAVGVETIRNLPLLLIIFFTYFALPEVGFKLDKFYAAILALVIFESAMLSEIVRSGLNSIEKGQIEAARSSGLTYTQTLWHIVLPQALRSYGSSDCRAVYFAFERYIARCRHRLAGINEPCPNY